MLYQISHKTRFRYAYPVTFARCNLRLKPIEWDGQRLDQFDLDIKPHSKLSLPKPIGYLGFVSRMVLEVPAREIVIESRMRIKVDREVPVPLPDDLTIAEITALTRTRADKRPESPANYIYPSPSIPLFAAATDWAADLLQPDRPIVAAGLALATRIHDEFKYDGSATTVDTPPAEAFAKKHGVCQDFAQIMVAALRGYGIPAAYVSGYLRTVPPPGKARLVGADATHAWAAIWCGPQRGWLGFDPTNACMVGPDHIIMAMGRDYSDVAPIDGVFTGLDGQKIDVSVDVEPV